MSDDIEFPATAIWYNNEGTAMAVHNCDEGYISFTTPSGRIFNVDVSGDELQVDDPNGGQLWTHNRASNVVEISNRGKRK